MKLGLGRAVLLTAVILASVANADDLATAGTPGGITDTSVHSRRGGFVAMVDFPYDGIGVALRYSIPVLPDGFIPSINDSFEIEPGANIDFSFWGYYYSYYSSVGSASVRIIPQANATWTFWFSDKFGAYALLGLGVGVGFYTNPGVYSAAYVYPYIDTGVGLKYRFSDAVSLRAEATWRGLRVGFQF